MTFACQQCGAQSACDGVRTATCPYCASSNVVSRPASDAPDASFVLPFGFPAAAARTRLATWLGRRSIFVRGDVRRAAIEELRGVYVPAYLYSAVARTSFEATIGEHYSETETYEATDAKTGAKETKTRSVTRTEHCPLSGQHVGYVTDVLASGSVGLAQHELAAIEPFDLRQLRRYDPALIAGWIAEEFSRSRAACLVASHREALDRVGERVRAFMPGDSYSDLAWRTTMAWESLDPVYVPVWVAALRHRPDRPPLRVVLNGQSGEATGRLPLSPWRVGLALLLLAALVAAAVLVLR